MQRAPLTHDRRVEDYTGLVRQIALQVASSIPRHVELDELVSAGTVGLVEASRRYDPERGVKFEAFVAERVRGSIIDFLRSLDWAPRSVRAAGKRIDEARTRLISELGRTPTDEEVAREVEMSVAEYRSVQDSLTTSVVLALDRTTTDGNDEESDSVIANVVDAEAQLPEDVVERKELCGYLADAVNCLPDQARTVIGLYYIEGMHMAEIGELLGVTQSRASQIHSAALVLLRDAILTQLDPDQAPDVSNPKGRRAKRLAKFYDAVANASDYRERLDDSQKTINLDFSSLLAGLRGPEDASSEPAAADADDTKRWQLIMDKSHEISGRRTHRTLTAS